MTETTCTAYPLNGCAHPQFCKEGCAGRPLRACADIPRGYPADIDNPDDWAAFLARYVDNRATNAVHNGIGLLALHIVDAIREARVSCLEAACGALAAIAIDANRPECCDHAAYDRGECCGNPNLLVVAADVGDAIRALKDQAP